MAGSYGDFVARTVKQGQVACVTTAWRPLVANTTVANGNSAGQVPLNARRHVRYQLKSGKGATIALAYTQKNQNGTYDTPTDSVKNCTIIAGNSTVVEPVGDAAQLYGKLVNKAGDTSDSIRVVVTEYS